VEEVSLNWKFAGDIAYTCVAFFTALFVLIYLLVAPWYRTQAGRNIMGVMASLGILMSYFGLAIWVGGVPFALYPMRFFLFVALGYFVLRRLIILITGQLVPVLRKRRENGIQLAKQRQDDRDGGGSGRDDGRDRVPERRE
jgi:hypothetical protein